MYVYNLTSSKVFQELSGKFPMRRTHQLLAVSSPKTLESTTDTKTASIFTFTVWSGHIILATTESMMSVLAKLQPNARSGHYEVSMVVLVLYFHFQYNADISVPITLNIH